MSKPFRTSPAGRILELVKFRIAVPISLSAATGYIIKKGNPDAGFLFTFFGVLLLAFGSMALNQIQERGLDARMKRTANRPLPSGTLSLTSAWMISLFFLLSGSLSLWLQGPPAALAFGWITVCWYNAVYTPLKLRTAFAVVPGAVVGALPPVIGWLTAGGNLNDHRIWLLSSFFFMGQIPHFWLLMLMLSDDYREAGLPTVGKLLTEKQIRRLTFIWIFWTAVISLFLAFFGVMSHLFSMILLSAGAFTIIILFFSLLTLSSEKINYKKGFIRLNVFYLYVMILLWIDSIIK